MKAKSSNHNFLLLVPLVIVVAAGVFMRTIKNTSPDVASITKNYSGVFEVNAATGIFEGQTVSAPLAQIPETISPVLGVASPSDRWIEVDLSDQKLKAWDGAVLFLETAVASGLPWTPTPVGEFRIWSKLRATRMEGGEGKYYYNLPNVPFVMFFENKDVPGWRGYGLHGTYWHNSFGTPRSHGCINLPTQVAQRLYYWTTPDIPEGKSSVFSSPDNIGTRIVIHE